MSFNPFDIPIGEPLDEALLQSLIINKVAEGFYVEYKRELPPENKKRKIGQSIASFANTYGGWYIVGVTTDEHNVATNIDGFSLDKISDPISKVRDIIKSHVNPFPLFFQQVVKLSNGNVVLVVYVPNNQDTPFITSDGKIYRRKSDSSDPVYEQDRYTLDRLVDAGKDRSGHFSSFCQDNRTFSEMESETSWLNIYFYPYPNDLLNTFVFPNQETVRRLLELSKQPVALDIKNLNLEVGIPFDFGQITNYSVILRQLQRGTTALNSLTVELFKNGCAKFFLPIPTRNYSKEQINDFQSDITRAVLMEAYKASEDDFHFQLLRFTDIGTLSAQIIGITNYYQQWLKDESLLTSIKMGFELTGCWRLVPFFDSDEWGTYVEEFGLPTIGQDIIQVPREWHYAKPIDVEGQLWSMIISTVGHSLGLPYELIASAFGKKVGDIVIKKLDRN